MIGNLSLASQDNHLTTQIFSSTGGGERAGFSRMYYDEVEWFGGTLHQEIQLGFEHGTELRFS